MLLKLIKEEFKDSYKEFLIVCLFMIVTSLLLAVSIKSNIDMIIAIIGSIYVIGLFVAFYYVIRMFYKFLATSIFSDQGYLTLVLPIDSKELILGKLIVGIIWYFAYLLSVFIGLFILFAIVGEVNLISLFDMFVDFNFFTVFKGLLSVFIGGIFMMSTIFCSLSIFNVTKNRSFKSLKIIGLVILFYTLYSFINYQFTALGLDDIIAGWITQGVFIVSYFFLSNEIIKNRIDLL